MRDIDGFPEPTWDDVLRRRAEWEPWVAKRLSVDSMCDLDVKVAEALAYLGAAPSHPG